MSKEIYSGAFWGTLFGLLNAHRVWFGFYTIFLHQCSYWRQFDVSVSRLIQILNSFNKFESICRLFLDPQQPNILYFAYIFLAIWTSFVLAEQLVITFMFTVKSRISVSTAASFILIVCMILSTGTVRLVLNIHVTLWQFLQHFSSQISQRTFTLAAR